VLFLSIQSNNAYIFPGLGLGLVISGAIRVHDDMLLAAGKFEAYLKEYLFFI
jgi:malate dehydrogenase (oxaloacetate-decarboxylating)(NADP+)